MTQHYVALFRGINVGRAKRIAMADLRQVLTDLGLGGVKTVLASGNVVFTTPRRRDVGRLEADIRRVVLGATGVDAAVTVLDEAAWRAVVAENPLAPVATDPSRLLTAIPRDPRRLADLAPLAGQDWGEEALALGTRAAYVWCPDGVLACRAGAAVEKALTGEVTARNWATVMKVTGALGEG